MAIRMTVSLSFEFELDRRIPRIRTIPPVFYDRAVAAAITPEEFRAYAALIASSTLLQRAVEANLLEQADLTQVQFEILMNLSIAGRSGIRMAQLADALIVSRSGLSYQVAQLESRGWITRQRSTDDERGVVARITPAGERIRRRVFAGHSAVVRTAFIDALEPGELATLTAALERVVGRLR
jgi:DNA-binding MarR family transcriptional regulator